MLLGAPFEHTFTSAPSAPEPEKAVFTRTPAYTHISFLLSQRLCASAVKSSVVYTFPNRKLDTAIPPKN